MRRIFRSPINLLSVLLVLMGTPLVQAEKQTLFIASPAQPPVIYSCVLDTDNGKLSNLKVAAEDVRSGFLALHPSKPFLYAASSENVTAGQPTGAVRLYRLQRDQGTLELVGKTSTKDNGNTHVQVAHDGSCVVLCHYGGKGTSAVALKSDGGLTDKVSQIQHEGSSVHPQRQTRPHPHGVAIHPNNRFVCVADLGSDRVEVFHISPESKLKSVAHWQATPGAGPRHVSFHPNGKWLYSINELDSTMAVLAFDENSGKLSEVQVVDTLPANTDVSNTTAEVVVHPNGKFVYGSNRGHNSTVVFAIDANSGRLKAVQHEPTQGDHPRFVGLDPTGKIYIAANMRANSLVTFHIDSETGKLKPTGHTIEVPRPMCVVFVR